MARCETRRGPERHLWDTAVGHSLLSRRRFLLRSERIRHLSCIDTDDEGIALPPVGQLFKGDGGRQRAEGGL